MTVGVYMWEKREKRLVSGGIDVKHFMDPGAFFWHGMGVGVYMAAFIGSISILQR